MSRGVMRCDLAHSLTASATFVFTAHVQVLTRADLRGLHSDKQTASGNTRQLHFPIQRSRGLGSDLLPLNIQSTSSSSFHSFLKRGRKHPNALTSQGCLTRHLLSALPAVVAIREALHQTMGPTSARGMSSCPDFQWLLHHSCGQQLTTFRSPSASPRARSPSPPAQRLRSRSPAQFDLPRVNDVDPVRKRQREAALLEAQLKSDRKSGEANGSSSALTKTNASQAEFANLLSSRSGGAYIPPARLRAMQAEASKDKTSAEYQRLSWEALRKSINGLINKVSS